jgi:membrane protease YdiL (CAAX protease family)
MAQSFAQSNIVRLRSVPWSWWNALLAFLGPWILLPLALYLVVAQLAVHFSSAAWFLQAFTAANPDPRASFILVILDAVVSFAAVGYFLHQHHAGLRDVGIRRFSIGRALLLLLILLVAFSFLIGIVYWLVGVFDPSFNATQAQTTQFSGSIGSPFSLLGVVIIPPLVEETVFRGFMFPAFSKRFGVVIGAILTSVLFGFAHLQGNVSVYTFVLSLLLCFLYVRLNSIIPGMVLHMTNNYIAYIALQHK